MLPHQTLRSLDALQIAAAPDLNADAIITYDDQMILACQVLGIATISPS
ncbi:MAG: hypothetical protein FWG16_08220 [Micrococcales bacterium]|nr:hypothetical protein [Micrococcales bacterium]